MFHLILYEPEIPPNTGNVIRMCANTGVQLHLVEPLGFELNEKAVRRAGMDYAELAAVRTWKSLAQCLAESGALRWFAVTTRGTTRFDRPCFTAGDAFVLGPESRGLPQSVIDACPAERRLRLPMMPGNRSLNLSNAAAVMVYEAWRQRGYQGSE